MAKFTIQDTQTGETLATGSHMSGLGTSASQIVTQAIAVAADVRRLAIAKALTAKGKGISTLRVARNADDGRYLVVETGERFAIMTKTYTLAATGTEMAENLTRDARRLKYGR